MKLNTSTVIAIVAVVFAAYFPIADILTRNQDLRVAKKKQDAIYATEVLLEMLNEGDNKITDKLNELFIPTGSTDKKIRDYIIRRTFHNQSINDILNSAFSPENADSCSIDYIEDGECDDGGPNAITRLCPYGTDFSDCGRRLPVKVPTRSVADTTAATPPTPDF